MGKRKAKKAAPSKKSAADKGNALEQALGTIEQAILRTVPAVKDQSFTVEYKKIVRVSGVKHEIDLYVTVNFAAGYKSLFIFECKNWAEPVDKNQVIVFSAKIQAVGASHGYFAAKSFTKDAEAQAKDDNRLTLLKITEHDPLNNPFATAGWAVRNQYNHFQARLFTFDGSAVPPSDPPDVQYFGNSVEFEALLRDWSFEFLKGVNGKMREFSEGKPPGSYEHHFDFGREFSKGQLRVSGKDVVRVHLDVKSTAHIVMRPVEYGFDIEGRGRVISFGSQELWPGVRVKEKFLFLY